MLPLPRALLATLAVLVATVAGCSSCTEEPVTCTDTQLLCEGRCINPRVDRRNCGRCGVACDAGAVCIAGACQACADDETICFDRCARLATDQINCGACGERCAGGTCTGGACLCVPPATACSGGCFDLRTSSKHCGACGTRCVGNQFCDGGVCELACESGLSPCADLCVDLRGDRMNCGACGRACTPTQSCDAGVCAAPPDPDGDGYTSLTNDCCETVMTCPNPAQVNPGVPENLVNGLDDDCDGYVDVMPPDAGCDDGLQPGSAGDAGDYARALDVCEGLVWAQVRRGDGLPLRPDAGGIGIHRAIGGLRPATGRTLLALGTGNASGLLGLAPASSRPPVSLNQCLGPGCLRDWFGASNGSLKQAGRLPSSPGCYFGSADDQAFDSIMLHLRLRAPATARGFRLLGRFYSLEYPEYVCTLFNDQSVVLTTSRANNPSDLNLLTYTARGASWPIGINVASGTPLFQACDTQAVSPRCWDTSVSAESCKEGSAVLNGTIFGKAAPNACLPGGATALLLTRGNVQPGEEFDLRIAIWDVGDPFFDSFLVVDSFQWLGAEGTPGTVGAKADGGTID
ncbi:MAG: hypothetical protein JNJ54_11085 [Myxococcaceae bacterium]|nr:hypothetical protein [Myxococcaceae bacterium]